MENGADITSVLWTHRDPTATRIWEFKTRIERKYSLCFHDYEALRQWSIQNIDHFWSEVWHFTGIQASKSFTKVINDNAIPSA